MSAKKYIAVNVENDTTSDKICMVNPDNEVCGTLKTADANQEQRDIREIFLRKDVLDDVSDIDVSDEGEGFTILDLANKFNEMLRAMKSSSVVALAIMLLAGSATSAPIGMAKLKTIGANQYVVTQEIEQAFWNFKTNAYEIGIGCNNNTGYKCVAIGSPLDIDERYEGGNSNMLLRSGWPWNPDFIGATEAFDRSVAIGDAAKALEMVSVAVGNQAHVKGLHRRLDVPYEYTNRVMIVTTPSGGGEPVTNILPLSEGIVHVVDASMYERLPMPQGTWRQTKVETDGGGNTVRTYEENTSQLYDMSCMEPYEYDIYDRDISSGQGTLNLLTATYGVAVGSRAYVFGYHGAAFGHYAHVSRPWGLAVGSESHVYSVGGQAFGYDTDIATNSPYCLAIGYNASIPSGMSNAIVIGVPDANGNYSAYGSPSDKPTAMKSNSINFVYHGDGLKDFYVDGVSILDRMRNEVSMIGQINGAVSQEAIQEKIREMIGVGPESNPIVFVSGDGGIHLVTQDFADEWNDDSPNPERGNIDKISINGMPLAEVIRQNSGRDDEFRSKVRAAATTAQSSVSNATSMAEVKAALDTFFNTIKE